MSTIDELISEWEAELASIKAAIKAQVDANATGASFQDRSVTFIPLGELRTREKRAIIELNRYRVLKDSGGAYDPVFGMTVTINRKPVSTDG